MADDLTEKKVYHDIDVYGNETQSGQPIEYFDEEAIKNALILYLTSSKGDYIRNPKAGGVLKTLLFKQMNDQKAQTIAFTIQNAIKNEFTPGISLVDLQVTPNYADRLWEIYIEYKSEFTKKIQTLTIYTDDLSISDSTDYIEIDYMGDNLYQFCVTKKPGMTGYLLKYNSTDEKWYWNRFWFSAFQGESDPRYSDIIEICNT